MKAGSRLRASVLQRRGAAVGGLVLACALAWCVLAVLPTHTFAQASEYEMKAAFLYNFALFTQPAEAASTPVAGEKEPYRICIFGKDPFGAAGMALAARTIAGRQIVLKHPVAIDELKQCQLVFIAESDHESARRVTGAVSGLPIITVGEFKDFPAVGAIFNLAVVDEKVAFQVDMQVARRQQLEVSAKLTRLATSVR